LVEAHYRVFANRDHRAIAGVSMGGAQALGTGLTHPKLFIRVAAFSPSLESVTSEQAGGPDFKQLVADSRKPTTSTECYRSDAEGRYVVPVREAV
jgi:enterochelin esterase-like enzyme